MYGFLNLLGVRKAYSERDATLQCPTRCGASPSGGSRLTALRYHLVTDCPERGNPDHYDALHHFFYKDVNTCYVRVPANVKAMLDELWAAKDPEEQAETVAKLKQQM